MNLIDVRAIPSGAAPGIGYAEIENQSSHTQPPSRIGRRELLGLKRPRLDPRFGGKGGVLHTYAAACSARLKNASRSALMTSACVVGIPCGKPGYTFNVAFFTSFAD